MASPSQMIGCPPDKVDMPRRMFGRFGEREEGEEDDCMSIITDQLDARGM